MIWSQLQAGILSSNNNTYNNAQQGFSLQFNAFVWAMLQIIVKDIRQLFIFFKEKTFMPKSFILLQNKVQVIICNIIPFNGFLSMSAIPTSCTCFAVYILHLALTNNLISNMIPNFLHKQTLIYLFGFNFLLSVLWRQRYPYWKISFSRGFFLQ